MGVHHGNHDGDDDANDQIGSGNLVRFQQIIVGQGRIDGSGNRINLGYSLYRSTGSCILHETVYGKYLIH